MKKSVKENSLQFACLLALSFILPVSAQTPVEIIDGPEEGKDITVTIQFDDANCPTAANATLSNRAKPGDKLIFVSDPVGQQYSLTFGPFVGKPYESNQAGEVKTLPLNAGSFASSLTWAEFKYSIYAVDCPVIDPVIIIDR